MLRDEILPYIQGDGLVSNAIPNPSGAFRNCDNGVLFTSEYYILLLLSDQLSVVDLMDYIEKISSCVGLDGYLHRAPGDTTLDQQDDHNGVYAAHILFGLTPRFKLSPNLWRFQQLVALAAIASKNKLYRFLAFFQVVYTALVILTSCIGKPISDFDSRIGSWLVVKATRSSWLCSLAAIVWKRRLMKDYPNGMRDVFALCFGLDHPIAKYAVLN